MRPFRFAVQASNAPDGAAWRAQARKVEDLGYSTLYIPDHFEDQFAPMLALTSAAEATSTLNVGTLVLGNDFRHPVVLAREAATLDLLSEGRLELGVGAGWMTADYDQTGIAWDPPGRRVDRLIESVTIMKALWRDGRCDFAGEHYTVAGATGAPTPHRRPHPTLVIGGGSPRVLGLAAREADIVGFVPNLGEGFVGPATIAASAPAEYDRRVEWVRQAAGARFDDLELQCLTFMVRVGPGGREFLTQMAPTFGMAEDEVMDVPIAIAGEVDEIVELLQDRRQRWGFSYWVVHPGELDDFAPVVAKLAGT